MQSASDYADPALITGNVFDKYRSTNMVHQRLVGRFVRDAVDLLQTSAATSILEVGAGPGDLAARILQQTHSRRRRHSYLGTDICPRQIAIARQRHPHLQFQQASIYDLPFSDRSFDIVIACEVLEHLTDPGAAVREAARVARRHVLASVPWEPAWRTLNVLRGKYWTAAGNTPGHLQHFSRSAIRKLIERELTIVAERTPFPWTMLLARTPYCDSDRKPRTPITVNGCGMR